MFNFLRPSGGSVQRINPKDAVERHAKGELVVIDVRDGMELRQGKAAGALHVPLMSLKMKCDPSSPECLPGLSLDTPIALYCASGARSQGAGQALMQMGYKEVYNLGGLMHWHQAGGAIER